MGAKSSESSSTLALAAIIDADSFDDPTSLNSPRYTRGVYWHMTDGARRETLRAGCAGCCAVLPWCTVRASRQAHSALRFHACVRVRVILNGWDRCVSILGTRAGYSCGFARDSELSQGSADVSSYNSAYRLSWHLGNGDGGWRAGEATGLNDDNTWYKVVYFIDTPCDSLNADYSVDYYGPRLGVHLELPDTFQAAGTLRGGCRVARATTSLTPPTPPLARRLDLGVQRGNVAAIVSARARLLPFACMQL